MIPARPLALAVLTMTAAALAPGASAAPAARVKVENAWCRAAPVGALAGGCFVTLTAAADDRLAAVQTPDADRAEIHTMAIEGGVMKMRPLPDGLPLPAGQAVELKPGARHLMVIGPKQPLLAGGRVRLTLRFEKAAPQTLDAPIRAMTPQ